jgi:hypothetical protein
MDAPSLSLAAVLVAARRLSATGGRQAERLAEQPAATLDEGVGK